MSRWTGFFEATPGGFRFPVGVIVQLDGFPTERGPVRIRFSSRYIHAPDGDPYPVALRAQVDGEATSHEDVLVRFWRAAAIVMPLVALAANGSSSELVPLASLNRTDQNEADFVHWLDYNNRFIVRQMKIAPKSDQLFEIIHAALTATDSDWIHRATVNYAEALQCWEPGRELWAVQNLFMAAEVLTRLITRSQRRATGLNRKELAQSWGIEVRQLESSIRNAVIFGDPLLARRMRDISDGLEHGFATVPDLQRAAATVRDEACTRIRSCILGLLDISPSTRQVLESKPYDKPAQSAVVRAGLAGALLGTTALLDDADFVPALPSDVGDVKFIEKADGEYSVSVTRGGKVIGLPEGVSFRAERGVFIGPIEDAGVATFDVEALPSSETRLEQRG